MRVLTIAAAAAISVFSGQAVAAPFTVSAVGTVVATDGTLDVSNGGVPIGFQIAGDWTVDTVFPNGTDDNLGIPTPEYDVQITFNISSYAEVRDGSGTPVPGQNVTTPVTALFYNDDETILAADLVGSVAEGLVNDGIYDIFELNAADTIGVQDPVTGEFAPFAPPGSGTAMEVILTVAGDSTWFTGAPSQLISSQPGSQAFIFITQYDEQGAEVGHLAATVTSRTDTAPSAIPLPGSSWALLSAVTLAGIAGFRQNRRG